MAVCRLFGQHVLDCSLYDTLLWMLHRVGCTRNTYTSIWQGATAWLHALRKVLTAVLGVLVARYTIDIVGLLMPFAY